MSNKDVFKHGIDYYSAGVVFLPPVMILAAVLSGVEFQYKTMIVGIIFYFCNMLGITMGYHRLWSHRAFKASKTLQWVLAIWGAGALQGSIKWWCRNHRVHHRYVDTDQDPYNAHRGFWFTHVGWMLAKRKNEDYGHVDVSDFKSNPIVMWQHINYQYIAVGFGLVAPTLICGLGWGDYSGGYFYAALLKAVLVHHNTFFINSLAHTDLFGWAKQNFSTNHTSHDSFFTALLTLGEGYHNFHHEFAQDYRNGVLWHHWDPTKWAIRVCEMWGSATFLIRVPNDVIKRNQFEVELAERTQAVEETKAKLAKLTKTVSTPTSMAWSEFEARCTQGEKLIVVGEYVLDMKKAIPTGSGYTHKSTEMNWYVNHPGGKAMLDAFVGKDATAAMSGGVYKHSQGAFNLVQHLRIANIEKVPSSSVDKKFD